jgi:predicted dehydrogenase
MKYALKKSSLRRKRKDRQIIRWRIAGRGYNSSMATTRRQFVQVSGLGMLPAAAAFSQSPPRSPNDRIQFATIGIGGMGFGDTGHALNTPGTKLAAGLRHLRGPPPAREGVARRGPVHHARLPRNPQPQRHRRRHRRHARPLHARISIDAMEAGKDVYVEKPMVQDWRDGHKMIEAARRTKRILQVGSQRVSSAIYQKAQDLFKAGAIGELNTVEAWWDRNSALGAWQYSIPTDASPATVDWDRFLAHAPKRPFEPIRLFRWRNYQDYGTGVAGDLFVHLFSGMHFITGAIGPDRIFASGGLRFWRDGRDVPDVMLGLYDYPRTAAHPAFNLCLRVNFVNGAGETSGFRFVGSEGVMTVGGGVSITKHPPEREPGHTIGTSRRPRRNSSARIPQEISPRPVTSASMDATAEQRFQPERGYSDHRDHFANFFSAVRSRKPVVEDAVFGLRAAGARATVQRELLHRQDPGMGSGQDAGERDKGGHRMNYQANDRIGSR